MTALQETLFMQPRHQGKKCSRLTTCMVRTSPCRTRMQYQISRRKNKLHTPVLVRSNSSSSTYKPGEFGLQAQEIHILDSRRHYGYILEWHS